MNGAMKLYLVLLLLSAIAACASESDMAPRDKDYIASYPAWLTTYGYFNRNDYDCIDGYVYPVDDPSTAMISDSGSPIECRGPRVDVSW